MARRMARQGEASLYSRDQNGDATELTNQRVDGLVVVALALILFMGFNVLRDRVRPAQAASEPAPLQVESIYVPKPAQSQEEVAAQREAELMAVAAPYDDYVLTQGLHGDSYGHMAIDLASGKGSKIHSPINGVVTSRYTDEYGNPTLIIENDYYQVTLLHGEYTVEAGAQVLLGQVVGRESNQGYTADSYGRLCRGRKKCGYHTHLNIFDKRLQSNVNPLDLFNTETP
jgi:murein DD-endopeptidase MepM/ murein hydrolase activator NlpD